MSINPKCIRKGCQNDALPGSARCARHQFAGTPGTGIMVGSGPMDPPIVISGGSITIEFDDSQLPKSGDGRHRNPNKRIKRVEITGDIDVAGNAESGFSGHTKSGKVTVKIFYGDT